MNGGELAPMLTISGEKKKKKRMRLAVVRVPSPPDFLQYLSFSSKKGGEEKKGRKGRGRTVPKHLKLLPPITRKEEKGGKLGGY